MGSGKSALLSALLGDIEPWNGGEGDGEEGRSEETRGERSGERRKKGVVGVFGGLAYAAQQAWIQNASLKDNILYGSEYDEQKYQETIRVCELEADLRMLPAHDETEVCERECVCVCVCVWW